MNKVVTIKYQYSADPIAYRHVIFTLTKSEETGYNMLYVSDEGLEDIVWLAKEQGMDITLTELESHGNTET